MNGEQQHQSSSDYELGVALVSILFTILLSVGFGMYSITRTWWLSTLLAIGFTVVLAGAIRIGGSDGVIPKIGRWVLGSGR